MMRGKGGATNFMSRVNYERRQETQGEGPKGQGQRGEEVVARA